MDLGRRALRTGGAAAYCAGVCSWTVVEHGGKNCWWLAEAAGRAWWRMGCILMLNCSAGL
jgi:hypothetical protein